MGTLDSLCSVLSLETALGYGIPEEKGGEDRRVINVGLSVCVVQVVGRLNLNVSV
jgi:hypothetical protein